MKSISEKTSWSSDDVRDARWKHGGDAMGSDTLHWYFLFPKGTHNDESVLEQLMHQLQYSKIQSRNR